MFKLMLNIPSVQKKESSKYKTQDQEKNSNSDNIELTKPESKPVVQPSNNLITTSPPQPQNDSKEN